MGGVRSYTLEEKMIRYVADSDEDEFTADKETEERKKSKKTSLLLEEKKTPIALICKVRFETQTRKDIEFQSSLVIANCSQHEIILYSIEEP